MASLGAGLLVGRAAESGSERVVGDFARAWDSGDYAAMHLLLTPEARARYPLRAFRAAYERAASTATVDEDSYGIPFRARETTSCGCRWRSARGSSAPRGDRVFLPVHDEAIDWRPEVVFPGLARGESLSRRSQVPERARIISADGKVLAEGPADARSTPLGAVGTSIAGSLAVSQDPRQRRSLFAARVPDRHARGRLGARAGLPAPGRGHPGRRAAGERARARTQQPASGSPGALDDRQPSAGGGRGGPGRAARRRGGTRRPDRPRSARSQGSRCPPLSLPARRSRS